MQFIQSPNIKISDSMKFNIENVSEKIRSILKKDSHPKFLISKEGDHEFLVKIITHYNREDFIAEAKGNDFFQTLNLAEKRILRSLSSKKEKIVTQQQHPRKTEE